MNTQDQINQLVEERFPVQTPRARQQFLRDMMKIIQQDDSGMTQSIINNKLTRILEQCADDIVGRHIPSATIKDFEG